MLANGVYCLAPDDLTGRARPSASFAVLMVAAGVLGEVSQAGLVQTRAKGLFLTDRRVELPSAWGARHMYGPLVFARPGLTRVPVVASGAQSVLALLVIFIVIGVLDGDPNRDLCFFGTAGGGMGVLILMTAASWAVPRFFRLHRRDISETLRRRAVAPWIAANLLTVVLVLTVAFYGDVLGSSNRSITGIPDSVLHRLVVLDELLISRHPGHAHHHLAYLGVRPDQQRKGVGSGLLTYAHGVLDAGEVSSYLEANHRYNRRLYLRCGYRDHGPAVLLPDGTPIWPMWRDPQDPSC